MNIIQGLIELLESSHSAVKTNIMKNRSRFSDIYSFTEKKQLYKYIFLTYDRIYRKLDEKNDTTVYL